MCSERKCEPKEKQLDRSMDRLRQQVWLSMGYNAFITPATMCLLSEEEWILLQGSLLSEGTMDLMYY